MMIKIQTLNMQYRGKKVDSIRASYQLSKDDSTLRGTGRFAIPTEDYNGSINYLNDTCKNHFVSNIDSMDYEIRSTNMVYEGGEIKRVEVVFSSMLENRELEVTGSYTITAEQYEENRTIAELEELAKEYLREESKKF